MPRPSKDKCRLCSKLSFEKAKIRHGPQGDGCWTDEGEACHKRRTYYRKRPLYNRNRRLKTAGYTVETVPLTATPAALLQSVPGAPRCSSPCC
ncbi:hypothetical protein [Leptolyngbya sp. FACHB-261]|uniref:hypothetical protein n=1 Tax=Leptolyngbya sp. FACHB-261 TaxID=2692806 RepID=UPI00168249F2|nr:hypothetical protein [Leptolyngbya sp. FACHB-261]MBD2100001.1 hypothetical protein [Leptolyngbya sp. FACHB-261]